MPRPLSLLRISITLTLVAGGACSTKAEEPLAVGGTAGTTGEVAIAGTGGAAAGASGAQTGGLAGAGAGGQSAGETSAGTSSQSVAGAGSGSVGQSGASSGGTGTQAGAAGAASAGAAGHSGAPSGGSAGSSGSAGNTFVPCPSGNPCVVLPLGDSITEGFGSSGGGYRVELFRQALRNGKTLTFGGSLQNGPATVENKAFPKRHEGHGGFTIESGTGHSSTSTIRLGPTFRRPPRRWRTKSLRPTRRSRRRTQEPTQRV